MKKKLLYEGKAKKVWATACKDEYVIEYKDDVTAGNGLKKESIAGKAGLNCAICGRIFEVLNAAGVETHYIKTLNKTEMLVKRAAIIPLEVIVRNVAAGSFSKKYGVEEGAGLRSTVVEYSLKDDSLGDPMISKSHIVALGLCGAADLYDIDSAALKVDGILTEFFLKHGMKLIDFKLEFGRGADGKILLADEISPDSCRLWDINTNEKLDKDVFRRDLGSLTDAYGEVYRRIMN